MPPMIKKRKSYKRKQEDNIPDVITNVIPINPYLINCYHPQSFSNKVVNCEDLLIDNNKMLVSHVVNYLNSFNYTNVKTKKSLFKVFLKYLDSKNIQIFKHLDYVFFSKYKLYLDIKYKNKGTKRVYYNEVLYFINDLAKKDKNLVHDDVLTGDLPKSFTDSTKSEVEKDLEHSNNSFSDEEYTTLLFESINIIKSENYYFDKIFSFMIIMSLCTGSNLSVLLLFTNDDLLEMCKDFEYIDFHKNKGRKGNVPVKITIKNYKFHDIKISELAKIILDERDKRVSEFSNLPYSDMLFIYPKVSTASPKNKGINWGIIQDGTYLKQVEYLLKKHSIKIKNNFNFSRGRKYFERSIYNISEDLTITSSLMGHSKNTASKSYLNTASGIKSHQKLAVTQDIIKGFSKNKETDNFIIYQELLNLFNLDLEEAIKLSNNGFNINEIIQNSQIKKDI
jgi:hypothetical protein